MNQFDLGKFTGSSQEAVRRLSGAICVSKALDQLWKQFIDARLQRNAKVPSICQFYDEFLTVGVTRYGKYQSICAAADAAGASKDPMPLLNPIPSNPYR